MREKRHVSTKCCEQNVNGQNKKEQRTRENK